MLHTVFVDIRHLNFWWGEYGFQEKSGNDEITIYLDASATNKLGYFEITTHTSLTYLYENELDDRDDASIKQTIKEFLTSDSFLFYYYIYPRNKDDLKNQVTYSAPVNKKNHKPIYVDMWTKHSDEFDTNEIKKCVKLLLKQFFNADVLNVELINVPTYEEVKESYEESF